LGLETAATGASGVAIGLTANAGGTATNGFTNLGATAIGGAAQAGSTGAGQDFATAVGFQAQANAANATALGVNATASNTSAVAIGSGATAAFAGSTALGSGAVTSRANQVAVGTVASTYTMRGITTAASLAAQTGPTQVVTTDAAGNLAAASFTPQDISALQSNVGVLQQNVTVLQQNVAVLQQQMKQGFEGSAIAIALGGAALPSDKRFAISTNWGNFRGQNAVGVGAQFRLTDYAVANVGVGGGFAQGGIGSRAGVTFAW